MKEINAFLKRDIIEIGKINLSGWDICFIIFALLFTKILLVFIRRGMTRYNKRKHGKGWDGNADAIFQLVRYFVWIVAFAWILNIANINLSFLVASSAALLVGIGFGLQQIFQDIISGIFILMERNVKVGDVMEVDQYIGHISHIGLRTSNIITRDGTNIIVPNHKFITNNVLNWSNTDRLMRFKISVGVAYGSNVQLVSTLLREAAVEHPDAIEEEDYPFLVRLVDFGESSLNFELLFWTAKKFAVENVKSELRFLVLQKFEENNISIPFPQRDVNIKNGNPL